MESWCEWVGDEAGIRARPFEKGDNHHLFVAFFGPLQAREERDVVIDATADEQILWPVNPCSLMSEYSDLPDRTIAVPTYSLAEIWAEKVRSLMQRSEPRDLYDLYELLWREPALPADALDTFNAKAVARGLNPQQLPEWLERREPVLKKLWSGRLSDQLADLPSFDEVWRSVRRGLRQAGYK